MELGGGSRIRFLSMKAAQGQEGPRSRVTMIGYTVS